MARKLLDRRVSVRRPPSGKDGWGQSIPVPDNATEWPEVAALWSAFTPVSDGEKWRAGTVSGVSVGWFVISARASVQSTDVLIFDGQVWKIDGVKPAGRAYQEITATAKGAAA
ncbi:MULTISPECIES: head-tail adaptor protein [unclassified Sulfitobacter]|uniref:head-tail adaptor protein n=1 Tax=unclassified Sulfitobacter TaxID=196795 RepID=UPI0007C27589|nr:MULTISPECIES: head-tail adaptor protein [unclassified Sulfitobacter]KZX90395.1 hypothetical protein A3720_10440 [Sulfitobacter sp. HI0021]KZY04221.1 hypothetical protein A3722_19540 [Sulfitobacter sp. HI0027]